MPTPVLGYAATSPTADVEVIRMQGINTAYERLFPGHVSSLKETDPELIEVFDTFAFDEVPACGSLDERTRMMALLAALIASQALGEYRAMLQGALNLGVTPVEAKEIVYQAVPYCGIGIVYDFLHATNEILTSRGVALPLEGQSTTSPETRFERGLALQREIFGERPGAPPGRPHPAASLHRLSPHPQRPPLPERGGPAPSSGRTQP